MCRIWQVCLVLVDNVARVLRCRLCSVDRVPEAEVEAGVSGDSQTLPSCFLWSLYPSPFILSNLADDLQRVRGMAGEGSGI